MSVLTIHDVNFNDDGEYECIAHSYYTESVSTQTQLIVTGKEDITQEIESYITHHKLIKFSFDLMGRFWATFTTINRNPMIYK